MQIFVILNRVAGQHARHQHQGRSAVRASPPPRARPAPSDEPTIADRSRGTARVASDDGSGRTWPGRPARTARRAGRVRAEVLVRAAGPDRIVDVHGLHSVARHSQRHAAEPLGGPSVPAAPVPAVTARGRRRSAGGRHHHERVDVLAVRLTGGGVADVGVQRHAVERDLRAPVRTRHRSEGARHAGARDRARVAGGEEQRRPVRGALPGAGDVRALSVGRWYRVMPFVVTRTDPTPATERAFTTSVPGARCGGSGLRASGEQHGNRASNMAGIAERKNGA